MESHAVVTHVCYNAESHSSPGHARAGRLLAYTQIYIYSGEKWGFDFCADEFLSDSDGVYVFEDTFELWATGNVNSNTMASALWDHVTNGALSDVCGVGAGGGTMMFSGANFREAETLDLDMRYASYYPVALMMLIE